ncbi:hypothetical protein MXB_3205 [Myxobolus squamalis]|nr:hypothetical protein MXB_3205 [Myxobolus squamalis]
MHSNSLCLAKNKFLYFKAFAREVKRNLSDGPSFQDFLQEAKIEHERTSTIRQKGERLNLPSWLKTTIPIGSGYFEIDKQLKSKGISTVCQEARCPNIGDCWNSKDNSLKTATIMVLGDTCTRGCRFCSVKTARKPPPPNPNEPADVAEAIANWSVGYIVITTVDRDDLMWTRCICTQYRNSQTSSTVRNSHLFLICSRP